MHPKCSIWCVWFLATVGLGCAASSDGTAPAASVVATIPPLADWCRVLVGDTVPVVTLLRPGQSPHAYEPTPHDARRVATAAVVVGWGEPVDHWLTRALTAADPSAQVVWLYDGARVGRETHPHAWLDPSRARAYVATLAQELARALPDHAEAIASRAATYDADLAVLVARTRRAASVWQDFGVVCVHDAWEPFLTSCGVAQVGSIHAASGAPPSARVLAELTELLRGQKVRVIVAEPQLSPMLAHTLAAEAAAEVIVLDPLGRGDVAGYDSYLAMMHSNLDALARVLPSIPDA